jgi:hypothetical protein
MVIRATFSVDFYRALVKVELMSDGTVELERFESLGVETVDDALAMLVAAMGS